MATSAWVRKWVEVANVSRIEGEHIVFFIDINIWLFLSRLMTVYYEYDTIFENEIDVLLYEFSCPPRALYPFDLTAFNFTFLNRKRIKLDKTDKTAGQGLFHPLV